MFANELQLAKLKERAEKWEADNFPGADPLMPPIIRMVNQLKNIAPIWSCEGHFKDEYSLRKNHQNFYLMLALTEEGFPTIQQLYTNLHRRLMGYQRKYDQAYSLQEKKKLALDYDQKNDIAVIPRHSSIIELKLTFTSRHIQGQDLTNAPYDWVGIVILNGQTYRRSAKTIFFRELTYVLEGLVKEQKQKNESFVAVN